MKRNWGQKETGGEKKLGTDGKETGDRRDAHQFPFVALDRREVE
jgi:hypothetical protein